MGGNSKEPDFGDKLNTWKDAKSGAFVRIRVPWHPQAEAREMILSLHATADQIGSDVLVRLERTKDFRENVANQNVHAGKFLDAHPDIVEVWQVKEFRSTGAKPHFPLRMLELVDEYIARQGGGVRIVFDNSIVEKKNGKKVEGFTTKAMTWRIHSGDLKNKEVQFFPAASEKERNIWIYQIS